MSEVESKEFELQAFRDEIKKLKESFPSLFAVKNIDDLQPEESILWGEYKTLFKQIADELTKTEMPSKEVVIDLKAKVENLAKTIRKSISIIKNENRLEFLAWMNNRLGGPLGDLDYLQTDGEEEGVLQEVKESMARQKKELFF